MVYAHLSQLVRCVHCARTYAWVRTQESDVMLAHSCPCNYLPTQSRSSARLAISNGKGASEPESASAQHPCLTGQVAHQGKGLTQVSVVQLSISDGRASREGVHCTGLL